MIFVNGLPETACGAGSTMVATKNLRATLPVLLRRLGISSMVDAPCGDFNWMAATNLAGIDYTGCDSSADHIATAHIKAEQRKRRARSVRFIEMDIVTGELPQADLLFCRDFLQHLPNDMALAALRNFVRSGSKWLLITSHQCRRTDDIADAGQFRPLNLKNPPWLFPKSRAKIQDPPETRRWMMLWAMKDVARCIE
jgi:hypothetical protein